MAKVTIVQCDFCKRSNNVITIAGSVTKSENGALVAEDCDICYDCLCSKMGISAFNIREPFPIPLDRGVVPMPPYTSPLITPPYIATCEAKNAMNKLWENFEVGVHFKPDMSEYLGKDSHFNIDSTLYTAPVDETDRKFIIKKS
jgi:hypothetical protein